MNVVLKNEIEKYIEDHREEMLNTYKDVINLEGRSNELDKLELVVERFKKEFEAAGVKCQRLPQTDKTQDYLVGIWGEENPGQPILFSGHYDTIINSGAYGTDKPFHIEDGKAMGPGVLDMKAGIVITLYVIKALAAIGYKDRPVKICFVSDEESCHEFNPDAGQVIMDSAKGCLCAFNMETGRLNNDLCIGRSARVEFNVKVNGVSVHAGNDFARGRNAIAEMAHKIIDFEALTDLSKGNTVNCGVIKGGTVANAIPGSCELVVDLRFLKQDEMLKTIEAAKEICAKTYIDGTTTEYTYRIGMPAFETINGVMEFWNLCKDVSEAYGYGTPGKIVLGGVSDASYITLAGVPAICSFGIRGDFNHTLKEYSVLESLYERTKLIAAICLHFDELKY